MQTTSTLIKQSRITVVAPAVTVVALLIFALTFAFYGGSARGRVQSSDEVAVLATAVNLVDMNTLAVDNLNWIVPLVPNTVHSGPDGHLYSKYFPGNALVASALYRMGKESPDRAYWWNSWKADSEAGIRIALLTNPLLGSLAIAVLLALLSRHYSPKTALLTVLIMALGSDWWYQSRGFFSEVGAGAFLLLSLLAADAGHPWASSLALGASLLFRPTNLLGLPVWLLAVYRAGGGRRAWLSGMGIGLGLACLGVYNVLRFGSPFNFGYAGESFVLDALGTGLYGIFFSPGRSVFLYSPILLLVVPGLLLLFRRNWPLALAIFLTGGGYCGMVAMWHSWDGGLSWGSRLLTPVILLGGVAVGECIERISTMRTPQLHRVALAGLAILFLVGLGINLIAMTNDPIDTMVKLIDDVNVTYHDTLYTVDKSLLALQWGLLFKDWQIADMDVYLIRVQTHGEIGLKN